MEHYYKDVSTSKGCTKRRGIWDAKGLSRTDFKSRGVCFVDKRARTCSKYENKDLMRYKAGTGRFKPLKTMVLASKRACDKTNDSCMFDVRNGQCYSKQIVYKKIDSSIRKIQRVYKERLAAKAKEKAVVKIQQFVRKDKRRGFVLPSDWPEDLNKTGVRTYIRDFYQNKKNEFPFPSERGLKNSGCKNPEDSKLSTTQSVLFSIARGYATGVTKSPRGVLCWHTTGSGKTCSAACVMRAYWYTDKPIVFCTSIEAKSANPPETFTKCIHRFFGEQLDNINKRVHFMSFAQLAHYLQLYRGSGTNEKERKKRAKLLTNGAVLIIDEVHNLYNPTPGQVKEHEALQKFLHRPSDKYTMFVFTATPHDGTLFDQLATQFYDASEDKSRFPVSKIQTIRVEDNHTKTSIVIDKITRKHQNDKHYVYSRYYKKVRGERQYGIIHVKQALDRLGFEQLLPNNNMRSLRPRKRYCILTTTQLQNKKDLLRLKEVLNSDKNKNGELCRVVLASQKFNEGVDLKGISHIHMYEPMDYDSEIQTMGRGKRYCSHSQLPMSRWKVNGYRYIQPRNVSVNMSEPSHYKHLRNTAIDCKLMKPYHQRIYDIECAM